MMFSFILFFLRSPPPPPTLVTSGIVPIPPGPSQCPMLKLYAKTLFQINSYESVYGLARLHTTYITINILLTYFNVLFLTISTILCGVALLPVSVATSCPRTPRSLCSTLSAPRSPTVGAMPLPL